jgi:hypothetical protein
MHGFRATFGSFAVIGLLCGSTACFSESNECQVGQEGCACEGQMCAGRLVCEGEICINPLAGSGSDGGSLDGPATSSNPSTTSTNTTLFDTTGDDVDDVDDTSVGSSSGAPDPETTTGAGVCGDGIVQDDEMCDGGPGCEDNCAFTSYGCNPLNNAGCMPPLRCGLLDYDTEEFGCMPPGRAVLGEACSWTSFEDEQCADGLTCLFNPQTDYCNVGNCCVEYCNLQMGSAMCSNGATCYQFFQPPDFDGLEHLGYCGA